MSSLPYFIFPFENEPSMRETLTNAWLVRVSGLGSSHTKVLLNPSRL